MRILVYEFVSGGGFAGRPVPASLAREGAAMRDALVADLAAPGHHDIVTTVDPRFPLVAPSGVEIVAPAEAPKARGRAAFDSIVASVDAVWVIAPETDRCLERLATRVESAGRMLLGSGAAAVRRASDKATLAHRLRRRSIPHPDTRVLRAGEDYRSLARAIGYPMVVKPARGAGCDGVAIARGAGELSQAVACARRAARNGRVLLQRYVRGVPASVSLLANRHGAVALSVNRQSLRCREQRLEYSGGCTPLEHVRAASAVDAAVRTCQALPGLRGFVGVDVVLTDAEAVVIEVNPRLTTAYLGVRAAIDGNVASMAMAACAGELPASIVVCRRVRFAASGRVVAA
jgi:predicted ATP-grasp superfamily ATP-dependent carboligase